jgi:hypothetical protein
MNERIKQLAEKAGFVLWGEETWNPGDAIDWSSRYDAELTKFVELIVKECLGCSNNLANHYIDNHSEKEQTLLLASIADYSNEIKKHFGVE